MSVVTGLHGSGRIYATISQTGCLIAASTLAGANTHKYTKTALYVILVCAFTSLDNSSYTTLISFIAAPLEIAQSGRVLSSLLQGQVFFQLSSSLFWPLKIMGLSIRLLSQHVDACRLIEWQGNIISVTPCAGSLVLIAVS